MTKPAPFGERFGAVIADRACSACGQWIWFTADRTPREADGSNHWIGCPKARQYRLEREREQREKKAAQEQMQGRLF